MRTVLLVLSPLKWEVFRYLGAGERLGLRLGYVCQEEPHGMPHALHQAYPLVQDRTVCMGMPDTIVAPADCFTQLLAFHECRGADLSLGIFSTNNPHALAPVVLDSRTGRVVEIADKPEVPPAANTWGIAAWSPKFTELLAETVGARTGDGGPEPVLSDVFIQAARVGLAVYGLSFADSAYYDIGTPAGLLRARAALEPAAPAPTALTLAG